MVRQLKSPWRVSRVFLLRNMTQVENERENNGYFSRFLQWRQTSVKDLENIDKKILDSLPCVQERKHVAVDEHHKLWSVSCSTDKDKTPIIMVHGMGGGVGLWALNLQDLSRNRPVYAFDLLGFGRSSRPVFSTVAEEAEDMFVESIENYRKAMGVNKFILLGHSLGGFLSAAYSLRYPQHVQHLMLVDPWGMVRKPPDGQRKPLPFIFRAILYVASMGYPMSVVRMLGPYGPGLVKKYRPQLAQTFGEKLGDNSLLHSYIYHCNAQDPSGEIGFTSMSEGFGWAKYPMIERMEDIDPSIPVTFVYGADSWIDRKTGLNFQKTHKGYVDVQILQGAGHHVYADRWQLFNSLVEAVATSVDENRLPNIEKELGDRIHGLPSSGNLQSLHPDDPDFQHPVGHGDENEQSDLGDQCDGAQPDARQ